MANGLVTQPFDYGRAIRSGTQNALNTVQFRQAANQINRQNALQQAFQQAAGSENPNQRAANILRQGGYGQAANQLMQQQQQARARDLQSQIRGMQLFTSKAPLVQDEESYQAFKQQMEEQGIADPGELPEQYGPETQQLLNRAAGDMAQDLELKQVRMPDGAVRYVPEQEAIGMEVPGQDETTQTEREVQRYIERGYPRSVAEDIAYGNIDVETDQFGNTYLVNVATGERRVLRGQTRGDEGEQAQRDEQDPIQPRSQEEQNLFEAVEETGPWAWLRSAGNNVIGPFMEGVPFEETAASKQQLRQFNYAVQQAFKQDDGRMSNYERQIIRDFLPDPDRVFTDPDKERTKLREMRRFLERQREQLRGSMEEKVTAKERGKLSNRIETIDRVLNLMGPEEQRQQSYTLGNPAQPQTDEEYGQLPSGAIFRDPESGELLRKP